jgi:hypothetical protein
MNSGYQNEFIANVRAALGSGITDQRPDLDHLGVEDSGRQTGILDKIQNRTNDERIHLLKVLIEQGKSINLKVTAQKNTRAVSQAIKTCFGEKPGMG